MLTFLRRAVFSTVGKIAALALLALIALAFALGDITNLTGGSAPAGGALVQVGDRKVTEAELQTRLKNALDQMRQQQPTLDMTQFVAGGGFDQVLDQVINSLVFEQYAKRNDMAVSKAAVDGEIAAIPAFQGPDGKFSQTTFDQVLAREGISADQLRNDIRRDTLANWLVGPTIGATQMPTELALPYASLMLERRKGSVGYVPITAVKDDAPVNEASVGAYYKRNIARYTQPERRVIRYAVVKPEQFAQGAAATDAEIAEAYRRDATKYAATTRRTLSQVIVADQAAANTLATRIKGGTSLAAAASAAGLRASTVNNAEKTAFAGASSAAIADAAFAAGQGTVVGPLRSPLGWHIVRVENIEQVAATPLSAVRQQIATEITQRKQADALVNLRGNIDSAINDNSTFDEAVADAKLKAETTPPLFADGRATQDAAPDPAMAAIAQAAFALEPTDDPQLIPIGEDGGFALIKTERVIASAPRPPAEVREPLVRDYLRDRRLQAARKAAAAILADIEKGTPIADAMRNSGLALPPLQPLDASRGQLAQMGDRLPEPVRLMFSMAANKAKITQSPSGDGYWIVRLDQIESGNAADNKELVNQTRDQIGQMVGQEYVQQFANALRKSVGVKLNDAAIARLKAQLTGQGGN